VTRPNAAQLRVLSFLALVPSAQFIELTEFEQTRRLRPGNDLFAPSLVARGWAEMGSGHRCSVRITDAGRRALANAGSEATESRL